MKRVRERKERGFTLTEVMVSLVIFMIAGMGLLPLLHGNLQANRRMRLQSESRRLAGEVMVALQVVDYADLAVIGDASWQVGDIEVRRCIDANLPYPGQSRITVTASWQVREEASRFRLQTVRTAP